MRVVLRRVALASLALVMAGVAFVRVTPFATAAAPQQLVVDDDRAQCPNAQFTSIQAAVMAAPPNSSIQVCKGTYNEQVRVETAAKNGLRIFSSPPGAAVIKAPPVLDVDGALVLIRAAQSVQLSDFAISGPATSPLNCGQNLYGVRVDGNGSALIRGNHITDIRLPPALFGCQTGVAVRVGQQASAQVGQAAIYGNVIERYQKGGIVIDGNGTLADVASNTVRGVGPTPDIAQNGIQISRGAAASVRDNTVSDNSYTIPTWSSSGILLFEINGRVVVDGNRTSRNDDNIVGWTTVAATISRNVATESPSDDGIYMNTDTARNRISGNVALNNFNFDCEDGSVGTGTAGTANTWSDNTGVKSKPPGLCAKRPGDRDEGPGKNNQYHRPNADD